MPNTLSFLEIDGEFVHLRTGTWLVPIFDGPFVWASADLEFTRQPVKRRSYVGLRSRGDGEWILFRTRALDAVCRALTSAGATEVLVPPVPPSEVLQITPWGAGLLAAVGAVFLTVARLATFQHDPTSHVFATDFLVAGIIAVTMAVVIGVVHIVERR
ncbi:hypothetical protein [Frondihabitans australicus]|uniref:hypothetical protein n=1 Tax=Frondihabitans australicus TaxID=386892 RepID=UPI000EB38DE1|nr:hypothetical protein [Frondihabitans australicus]